MGWIVLTECKSTITILTAYLTLTLSLSSVKCRLITEPVDTVSGEGQTTQLNCSTSLSVNVNWDFVNTTGSRRTIFGRSGIIMPHFKSRFNMIREDGGHYNLVIRNVSFSDAGKYFCIDDRGFGYGPWANEGLWATADLIVIALHCTHNISDNGTFGGDFCGMSLQPDIISMTCNVKYRSNIKPPALQLQWIHENRYNSTKHVNNETLYNFTVTSTVVVQANERMNGSQFFCSVFVVWNISATLVFLNVTWPSPVINMLFVNNSSMELTESPELIGQEDEVHCRYVHANIPNCNYSWTMLKTGSSVNSSILKLSDFSEAEGCTSFQCSAHCPIRDQICRIFNITTTRTIACSVVFNEIGMAVSIILLIPDVLVLVLVIICLFTCLFKCKICFNDKSSEQQYELQPLTESPATIETVNVNQTLSRVISHHGPVYGITVLENTIYVVSGQLSTGVASYCSKEFKPLPNIAILGSKSLWSIASCQQNNVLYISDDGVNACHRYEVGTKTLTKWPIKDNLRCQGLSVTKQGNVLVTVPKKIQEYTANGDCIRSIELKCNIDRLQHSIELSDGVFVVSNVVNPGVHIVDAGGKKMSSAQTVFPGSESERMKPRHMVVCKDGSILVANEYNKIELFKLRGTDFGTHSIVEIFNITLDRPRALYLDEVNDRLFIGDNNRVIVMKYE